MKCAWVQWRLLTAAPLAGAALRHAETCPACRAVAERQAALDAALRRAALPPVPPESLARCLRGVRERIVLAPSAPRAGWRDWLTLPAPVPAMAAAALAAVVLLGVNILLREPVDRGLPPARVAYSPAPSNAPAERWVKLDATSNDYVPVVVLTPAQVPSPAGVVSNPRPGGVEYGPGATRAVDFKY